VVHCATAGKTAVHLMTCPRALSPSKRRARMAAIHRENTKPELVVRRVLWRLGARYRLHAKELPGRPDVVMRPARKAVFVNGCLWHLHEGCPLARVPTSRPDYWPAKLARNKERDRRNLEELRQLGWTVEVVWECETRDQKALERRLRPFLAS
jgi:DNA mismatch endonuclease Vsr